MTPIERLLQGLLTIDVWDVVKLLMIVGIGVYLMFGVILIRQVNLMCQTLTGTYSGWLKVVAWFHLGVAVAILVLAVVVL